MRYQTLPGTSVPASAIVLGTAWFGTDIPGDEAFRLLDTFAECGGTFLDSAHMYANWVPGGAGQSESTVGAWLQSAGRGEMRVATKGADREMTREGIRAQLAESLDRLRLPRIDFYWLHVDKPAVPAGEIIDWLNELVDEGLVGAFGCSNWSVARMREAHDYAARNQRRDFAASQIGWSLARVAPEIAGKGSQVFMTDEVFAYHCARALPLVAYSSQAGGFFAGNYDPAGPTAGGTPNPNIVRYYGTPDNYARLAAVNALAAQKGCTPNQVALAFLLQQPFPGFPIVGANSPQRVADSCGAAEITLTADEVAQLARGAEVVA